MINDISIEDQVSMFLAGFSAMATLVVPYVIYHYARRAKNTEA